MSRILIVDDSPGMAEMYAKGLRALCDHRTTAATSGVEAVAYYVEALGDDPFDLVLLDLAMPTQNGFQVADEIKGLDPDVKFAFVTAYDEPMSAGRSEVSGALALISKPISPSDLCAEVAKLLLARTP